MNMIQADCISKSFRIGHKEKYLALRDSLASAFKNPLSLFKGSNGSCVEEFWALKDVSFDIKRGESVGIIGRNGAGKTTLLKILSRITFPTKGEIKLYGRVASLLEVGTGFHPELTGRENIYFNGSILGMKKKEIDKNFDQIVAFAEVEKFIDTPIKHYSSGMTLRLAFSVAAHLDPEILIVDEVLAVGDAIFQKKCIGKMSEVAKSGRTVLFVSHNMEAVERLCSRTILFNQGTIVHSGATSEVIRKYLKDGTIESGKRVWEDKEKAPGNNVVRLSGVYTKNVQGEICSNFDVQEPVTLEMEYWVLEEGYPINAVFYLFNEKGHEIFLSMDNLDSPWRDEKRPKGLYRSKCFIPANFLNNGQISMMASIASHPFTLHMSIRDVLRFDVTDSMNSKGVRGNFTRDWPPAAVRPRLSWTVEKK